MAVFQDITPRATAGRWGPKNPGDLVNYWVDMSYWLPEDTAAVSATVTVADTLDQPPPGPEFDYLSVLESEIVNDSIRIKFSGGVPGNDYPVRFVVTTDTAEVYPFTCVLPVKERRTL